MPAFRTSGSTGVAPTTAFMGAIPDRGFTLLRPSHYAFVGNYIQVDSFGPANYVNLWTPYNLFVDTGSGTNAATVSVGATVTAPDGTSSGTASHIVEVANTGFHQMVAWSSASPGPVQYGGWSMRLAVIAKAAERTRIALTITGNAAGSQTIFDLAGVQIGVANTVFNLTGYSTPTAGPATITSLGNGWCLCMMDTYYNFGQNLYQGVEGTFNIDAGSGTGGANLSYLGDVTKGVDVWRAIMLPPGAWAMSGAKVLYDDFNSISTIDINNTKAPGFNWYVNNIFPGGGFNSVYHPAVVPTPSGQISVSSSVLTLQQQSPSAFLQAQLMTAASVGDNTDSGIVGQGFLPPFLWEIKSSYDNVNQGSSGYLQWSLALGTLGIGKYKYRGIEFDPFGVTNSPGRMIGTLWTWIIGTDNAAAQMGPFFSWASTGCAVGYNKWDPVSNFTANGSDLVNYGGVVYAATNMLPTNNVNNPPPNASFWSVVSPTTTNIDSYSFIDFTQMNVYSTLVLPTTLTEAGWIINFFNGAPCGQVPGGIQDHSATAYSPLVSNLGNDGGGYLSSWTADPIVLILYAGNNSAQGPTKYDYISVIQ